MPRVPGLPHPLPVPAGSKAALGLASSGPAPLRQHLCLHAPAIGPPELLLSSLLVLGSQQLSGSSGRVMGKMHWTDISFVLPCSSPDFAQGILNVHLGHPWGVGGQIPATRAIQLARIPSLPREVASCSFPYPLIRSQVGWSGVDGTRRVSPPGLLGREVKAKGADLSVCHGSVNFLLVLPTALECSPGTSLISLLSLSDGGRCVPGTHLTDASTLTPPHLPAPKEPGVSSALLRLGPSHRPTVSPARSGMPASCCRYCHPVP